MSCHLPEIHSWQLSHIMGSLHCTDIMQLLNNFSTDFDTEPIPRGVSFSCEQMRADNLIQGHNGRVPMEWKSNAKGCMGLRYTSSRGYTSRLEKEYNSKSRAKKILEVSSSQCAVFQERFQGLSEGNYVHNSLKLNLISMSTCESKEKWSGHEFPHYQMFCLLSHLKRTEIAFLWVSHTFSKHFWWFQSHGLIVYISELKHLAMLLSPEWAEKTLLPSRNHIKYLINQRLFF